MGRRVSAQARGWDGLAPEGDHTAKEMAELAVALRDLQITKNEANRAANEILTACETILAALDNSACGGSHPDIENAAIEIMTACGFEDLVGQRATHASKIVKSLMAKRLEALGNAPEAEDGDERLSQTCVDAYFADE